MPSDMLHTPNTNNMSKTCMTWTQNVISYHKEKSQKARGTLAHQLGVTR
jgi:hypothetical protein